MNVSPPPALTSERRRTLHAVMQRILPGVHGPGAARADVAAGFERALSHAVLRGLIPAFEGLLDQLQAQAAERHARDFCVCTASEQDELLRDLERGPSPWPRMLFRSLIGFSLEGLLGDPLHGGNRDFSGWESIGYRAEDVRAGFCRGARDA